MRIQHAIILSILAAGLGGCESFDKDPKGIPWGWPFVQKPKDVPATSPGGPAGAAREEYEGWVLPPEMMSPPATPPGPEPQDRLARNLPTPPVEPPPKPAIPRDTTPPVEPPPKTVTPRDTTPPVEPPPKAVTPRDTTPPVEPPGAKPGETRIVATSALQVNKSYISMEDVLRRCRKQLQALPANLTESGFRLKAAGEIADALRDLITEVLVMDEAEKNVPDALKQEITREIDAEYQEMLNEIGQGSKKKLEHAMVLDGTTLKTVLDDLRRRVTVRTYLRSRFMPSVTINRRMLLEYYQRHREEFSSAKKVQMQIIFVSFKRYLANVEGTPTAQEQQAAHAQAKAEIDKAAQALMAGEPFEEVANRLSHGTKARQSGLWPLMPAGSFRYAEVEKAAFAMEEGRISLPIETEAGFFIVKAKKVVPGKEARFEDAQPQITEILRQQQYRDLTEEYFKKLLERCTIGRTQELIASAVGEAVARYWGKARAAGI